VNGAEAVIACKTNPAIDLVIMDIKMPVMDGFEATRLIKQKQPDLPVIIQTAYSRESDMERAFQCGCDGYVSKPIVIDQLIGLMKNSCQLSTWITLQHSSPDHTSVIYAKKKHGINREIQHPYRSPES
jgi:CheY-like chemotaxis protein